MFPPSRKAQKHARQIKNNIYFPLKDQQNLSMTAPSAIAVLSRRTMQFLAIFETGNVHRAAEQLGISQPALSMSLKQFEDELGVPLFRRLPRGVVPTEAGEILYRYAASARHSARLATEEIAALASGTVSKLRLGAGVAWTTTVLPSVLSDLHTRYPGMLIDVVTGVGDQLAALFLAGEIDVLLAAGSMSELDAPDIKREFVVNLAMRAVADPDNELARRDRVDPADLVTVEWAGFYEDEGFLHLVQHYMAERGLGAPKIALRTNSAAALTSLVKRTNVSVAWTAPSQFSPELRLRF
ncbi:hypothetical protein C1J04_16375 (plasmid) [Sulfitobacter sp. SK025]|nr:hypothetical protein C1J04_16375 [Sulfitobacter sp. SK025]